MRLIRVSEAVMLFGIFLNLHVITDALKILSSPKLLMNYVHNRAEYVLDNALANTQCAKDMKSLFSDLISMKKWALYMIDASGKVNSGMLYGNVHMIGNFDQCLNISELKNDKLINGQYCTVIISPSTKVSSQFDFLLDVVTYTQFLGINLSNHTNEMLKNYKVTYGLCIPHSCSIGNLQKLWNYVEDTFRVPAHLHFHDFMCTSKDKEIETYDVDKYIIAFFAVYMVLLVVSTLYDLVIHQHIDGKQDNFIVAFSLFTNAKKLSTSSELHDDSKNKLTSLNGLKVISMFWVIYGHRATMYILAGSINSVYVYEWKKRIDSSLIFAGHFSVDTFLLASGLLISYTVLNNQDIIKRKGFSAVHLYIGRFLRLSPALFATILFYISIYKHIGDGPFWAMAAKKLSLSCRHTWWASLLFINNILDYRIQCVEQSWYLAVDTQLFLVSPIIMKYLLKKPVRTCLSCIGACVLTAVYTFVITYKNEYGALSFESNVDYIHNIYYPTLIRMPPWLIGIVFGYLIFKYRNVNIPKVTTIFSWVFLSLLLTSLILMHSIFTQTDEYQPIRAAMFNSCARQAWALGIASVIFLCTTGHGGKINEFLSWPVFQVLSRLSYSVYMVQLAVQLYFVGVRRHSSNFSVIDMVYDLMGDLFFIFVVATIWCLAFESPFITISKMLFENSSKKPSDHYQLTEGRKKQKKNKKGYMIRVYEYEADIGTSLKKLD